MQRGLPGFGLLASQVLGPKNVAIASRERRVLRRAGDDRNPCQGPGHGQGWAARRVIATWSRQTCGPRACSGGLASVAAGHAPAPVRLADLLGELGRLAGQELAELFAQLVVGDIEGAEDVRGDTVLVRAERQ